MYMPNINLPIPEELLTALDEARGDVPRTVWIRRAIEQRLAKVSALEHRCYGPNGDDHSDTCYCGKPAVAHVFYGTGCGNVCAKHAQSILKTKRLPGDPSHVRWLSEGADD